MEWAIVWACVIAYVIMRAARRGKTAVKTFYRSRVDAWKGSKPQPAPAGVKAGAALATGLVGGVLFTRGFVAGVVQGWPDGAKAGRDWYQRHLADRPLKGKPADMSRCPKCRINLARLGWPIMHNNRQGEVCPYDWQTDPRWSRCPDCRTILIPGIDTCLECEGKRTKASPKKPAPAKEPAAQPAATVTCAHTDKCGNACPEPADLANNSIYCTGHTQDNTAGGPQRLRLVRNTDAPTQPGAGHTEGVVPVVDTMTGGEVRNLEQAFGELDSIEREATAELEDARAAAQRAEEDGGRYERFAQSMNLLKFSTTIVGTIGQLMEESQGRVAAANARAAAAERALAIVGQVREQLAPHANIREQGQAAGGVAASEAYAG